MDRFFDRLGDAIKNFLDDEDDKLFGSKRSRSSFRDPDLEAAEAELDEFLRTGKTRESESSARSGAWSDPRGAGSFSGPGGRPARQASEKPGIPEALRADFAELGVPFGASADECKAAYKKLLKVHHPDRHAGHPGNMKKATEKSARINAAHQRIERWRETGKVD
jgi:DnaJ-domain-containing protein 1